MSQNVTPPAAKTGNKFVGALMDLLLLTVLLGASGFGGYFWGIHQQLAPILKVGMGTPGAMMPPPMSNSPAAGAKKTESGTSSASGTGSKTAGAKETAKMSESKAGAATQTEESASAESSKPKSHGAKKFWIASSGVDYIGYSITAKVNGTAVDAFFGPGKIVDVTHLVKPGDNSFVCEAKEMGDQYNKHSGDGKSKLTLQLVSDAHISDNFKKKDVLLSYERSAADSEDSAETQHFSGE